MKIPELLGLRLHHQKLTNPENRQPRKVVEALVAMQAQEYAMAKWAIGLRMAGAVEDADIERAFNAGKILRTHVLRPTWHFVSPADIRWLLALTAPRVQAANAYMYRKMELDARVFKRGDAVITRALRDGCFLTRTALQKALARAGIRAEGTRLSCIVMHAELEALICSGPRQGRQFTYALLDTRAPATRPKPREDALVELSRRYFASRGPATAQDFAMWSGLTLTDARAGLESLGREFERVTFGGRAHAFLPAKTRKPDGVTFLMPDYDEYGMSYKDRSALRPAGVTMNPSPTFNRMIVVDGQVVGSWRRTLNGDSADLETDVQARLTRAKSRELAAAIGRFRTFVSRSAE